MKDEIGTNYPVIVMVDKKGGQKHRELRQWFMESRFLTYEAEDIMEALEEFYDFTVHDFPDVILLDVASIEDDYPAIVRFVHQSIPRADELQIFAYSETDDYPRSVGSLGQLKMRLDQIVPVREAQTAGTASA